MASGEGQREPFRSPFGVCMEGEGKALSISDIDPVRDPCPDLSALSLRMLSMPTRLAVRPRSRFEASLVARRMSSGRLVELPLVSPACAVSRFSRGGRLSSFSLIDGADEVIGEAVPLESKAPAFSRPPSISVTLGSSGDVGDRASGDGAVLDRPFGNSLGVPAGEFFADEAERNVAPPPLPSDIFCRSWKGPGLRLSPSPASTPSPLFVALRAGLPGFPVLTFLTNPVESSWSLALDCRPADEFSASSSSSSMPPPV